MGAAINIQTGAESYYTFHWLSANFYRIYKYSSGSRTTLREGYDTVGLGDTIKLCNSSGTLTPYINGAAQTTTTDSSITGGYPGIELDHVLSTNPNSVVDSWVGANN
jgi:hypothetical protein